MIRDGRGLEQRQLAIVEWREPWGVLVREHGEDAGQRAGARASMAVDAALAIVLCTGKAYVTPVTGYS